MAPLVLPLVPLDGEVLLPGHRLELASLSGWLSDQTGMERSRSPVAAALRDEDSVHEIGVIAAVETTGESTSLRGIGRCRLLALVQESIPPLVEVKALRENTLTGARPQRLASLLRRRFQSLRQQLGQPELLVSPTTALSPLTWTVVAGLGLSAHQQQGFLNLSDPVDRGRLLLLAIRELSQRERFLKPWSHLREGHQWN